MHFVKYQGLGNDFIFIDAAQAGLADVSRTARRLCDRRFGIGADGLILLGPSDKADARMRIINSDGSEAEMCGNASRCAPLFWRELGRLSGMQMKLDTLAGLIAADIMDVEKGLVRVNMGVPRLMRGQIPMTGPETEQAVDVPLEAAGNVWMGTAVSMGNPHFVVFVPDISQVNIAVIGAALEKHPSFPRKTNVEFVQVLDKNTIRMRVWERGAGITQACGTGSCAAAVAGSITGRTGENTRVILDGGELQVSWRSGEAVWMTGPAKKVFEGEYTDAL